ncbi:TonB-dependent receptor [Pedobacter sp. AW1-32]|uniref:TonB-dependent receptor n=1 Tax=Pedobacter sp. AW1-32 TaxID=3383026 RepID=UPI003FEEC4FD
MIRNVALIICLSLSSLILHAQDFSLSGLVSSTTGKLENVNVKILSAKQATKSDKTGAFAFSQLAAGHYNLIFSALGYQTQTITIQLDNNLQNLNVVLLAESTNLGDVVVTGVGRATALRKSPVPIAIISKKNMEQNVNTNLIEGIVKGVPGVSAVTTGPNVSKPFIRGLGYNRVLTLYDGLRQEGQQWGDEHGIEVDEYSIGRAEVVKGPASLTYGSDALAGVINMIPDLPNIEEGKLQGDVLFGYQSNNGRLASSIGLAYKKNNWTYLFRGSAKMAHNYRNPVDGLVYGTGFREYNLSASARVDQKWGFSKTAVTYYENLMEIPDGSRDSLSRRFTRQILDEGDDIRNRPVVSDQDLSSYRLNPLHQHIQHVRVYNTSQFNLGEGQLNTLLGLQQSVRQEYNHPTLPQQAGLYVVLNTLNYDVKYNFPSLNGLESTLGINGMFQQNRSKDATDFPIPDYDLFDVGAFYYAKKSFGKLDVSGGLRFDKRNTRWNNFYVGKNPNTGFDQKVSSGTADSELQFPAFSKNYYGLSGSLGFTYNLSEHLLFKANIARGYRAPNITEIGSNGLDPGAHIVYLGNRSFKPEFNLQQDIGVIAYLKDVDLSLELFNNAIQNYIYQTRLTDDAGNPVVIVPGNLTYQYQQAKARLYGAEVAINIHPRNLKWLSLNNSLAYVVGLNKNDVLLNTFGADAKYLPFIPPMQIRSELKFEIPFVPQKNVKNAYLKFDVAHFGSQNRFYALDNTETFTKGYTLFNAGLGSSLVSKAGKIWLDWSLQVDNIFNVAYQSHLNRLKYFEYYQSSPNGTSGIYNMGRNISLKVRVPF